MDLGLVSAVQVFDSFKSVPCPYPIPGLEDPTAALSEFVLAGYYEFDSQSRCSDSHSYSQFSVETTSCTKAPSRAVDESTSGIVEGAFV